MSKLHVVVGLLCCCLASPTLAANAQQNRMKTCNAAASQKSLAGDARKTFMSGCLKGASTPPTQQEKMKTCNTEASGKSLKGDDRKAFMSTCLKK